MGGGGLLTGGYLTIQLFCPLAPNDCPSPIALLITGVQFGGVSGIVLAASCGWVLSGAAFGPGNGLGTAEARVRRRTVART